MKLKKRSSRIQKEYEIKECKMREKGRMKKRKVKRGEIMNASNL